MTTQQGPNNKNHRSGADTGIELVRQSLDRLRYGAIHLTVHDGKLVQVDVTERHRTTE